MIKAKEKRDGKYITMETLGRGGTGKVKRARHVETGEFFAIKVIEHDKLKQQAGEESEAQLKREITVMRLLEHDNVVKLIEVMRGKAKMYLVMEFVNGGELYDVIVSNENKRLSEEQTRRYFGQLISGVSYCHSQQVAHRDLKPENILVDKDDNLKITDFGLSNLQKGAVNDPEGGGTFLETVCGTHYYIAPEVLEGSYNGITADIWSCGVILFVMLSGRFPFDLPDLPNKIKKGQYKMPSQISEQACDLISKMLQVVPEERIDMNGIREHVWLKGYEFNTANTGEIDTPA
eukprot:TRINITY_DN4763_c1_g1_i1.p1 TRINITY_DN4763_c1_g1~~TRINITY_DN4763_c1_g1_i1.p1  ORF type:complete len:291 (+),score=43.62 TRINITY_DN4763_c1_g1_i1:70-942(+)